jgi:hypothetical protein
VIMKVIVVKEVVSHMNTSKKHIVFIATTWGSEYGGVNSFNFDLCSALAKILPEDFQLVCVVVYADQSTIEKARGGENILLVPMEEMEQREATLRERDAQIVLSLLETRGIIDVPWWVGHDVLSGPTALQLKKLAGEKSHPGKTVIFHHMDYEAYKIFQEDSPAVNRKIEDQKRILRKADFVFGVGDYLTENAKLKRGNAYCIIPGLQIIQSKPASHIIRPIIFGRLDKKTDIIKQSVLAVKSVAFAYKKREIEHRPKILVIGIDKESNQHKELLDIAEKYGDAKIAVNAAPYTSDRDSLFDELSESNVCLMLSLHEGFGLVGWESIAAGVPLIVSEESGLWKYLNKEYKPEQIKGIYPIRISGSNEDVDLIKISKCLKSVYKNIEKSKADIESFKQLLKNKYTWENAAKTFVDGLGLKFEMKESELLPAVCLKENPKEIDLPDQALNEKESNPKIEIKSFPQLVGDLQDARQIHTRLSDDLECARELSLSLANLFTQLNSDEAVLDIYKDVENKWHDCHDKFDRSIKLMDSFKKHEYAFFKKYTEALIKLRGEFDTIFHSSDWNIEDNKDKSTREFVEKLNHQGEAIHQEVLYAMGEVDKIILDNTGELELQMNDFRRSLQWLVK